MLIILIAKIIYALIPVLWSLFLIIYINSKSDKIEKILIPLSIILFIYGFMDCLITGLTLLGIE